MRQKVTILPKMDTQIQRTLALLKVAAVISKDKFEKWYKVVHQSCSKETVMAFTTTTNS